MQHIPVIAVTSYAMVGDREKCLAAGAEGYIEKPINPESFVAEIERFLLPRGSEVRSQGSEVRSQKSDDRPLATD